MTLQPALYSHADAPALTNRQFRQNIFLPVQPDLLLDNKYFLYDNKKCRLPVIHPPRRLTQNL